MKSFTRGLLLTSALCAVPMLAMAAGDGKFHTTNGQVIDPNGQVFVAHGPNVDSDELAAAIANAAAEPLMKQLPHTNFVRVPLRPRSGVGTASAAYPDPSTFAVQIARASALGIVLEFEDHSSNGGQWECFIPGGIACQPSYPPTGAALAANIAYWAKFAAMYAGNPYIWFGSLNEINSGNGTYSTEAIGANVVYEDALYRAIRAVAPNTIIQMANGIGGGNPGTVGVNGGTVNGAPISTITSTWHNVTWYIHRYYTDGTAAGALAYLTGSTGAQHGGSGGDGIAAAQTLLSGDGKVPVIIDECGSGDGNASSKNASSIVDALGKVHSLGVGFACWAWYPSTQWQMVINGNVSGGPFSNTVWGNQMSALIASLPGPTVAPPVVVPPVVTFTESANNTVITASTDAAIVGSTGEKWTLTAGGQIAINGVADSTTRNVVELAYVNHQIWQENASNLWWGKTLSTGAWSPAAGTATSPLPVVVLPPPGPSAEGAKVLAPSGAALNYAGSLWTILNGVVMRDNAVIADVPSTNAVEIEIFGGVIAYKNSDGQWFRWPYTGGWGVALPSALPVN